MTTTVLADDLLRNADVLIHQPGADKASLAHLLRFNIVRVKEAALSALSAAAEESEALQLQLAQRGHLLSRREANLSEVEARHREQAASKLLDRMATAQRLVCERAVSLSRASLLGMCWRALVLHWASSKILADRKQFRVLAQQSQNVSMQRALQAID